MDMRCKYVKLREDAVCPQKAHSDDSGYDIYITHKIKDYGNGVSCYGTGIAIEPPPGFYFELYSRSSLPKSGYTLANNVGIVDYGYRGELMVQLYKLSPETKELKFPARVAQVILKRNESLFQNKSFTEVEELSRTYRGNGGLGSTG
jgi:dUTP pyrophosphatase